MHPLHDLIWSLQQGKLHELFLKDSLTVATWGLGVATFLLVADSWSKGREQRKRWDREDEQRKQDRLEVRLRWKRQDDEIEELRKPRYRLGLDVVNDASFHTGKKQLRIWLANIGRSGLYLDDVVISWRGEVCGVLPVKQIAESGGRVEYVFPSSFWKEQAGPSNWVIGDYEIWARMADESNAFESQHLIYNLLVSYESVIKLVEGSDEQREVFCPKCGQQVSALLPPTKAKTEDELCNRFLKAVEEDFAKTCPNHKSSLVKWIPVHAD